MADLQKERDERAEKTPSSESTQRTPQDTNLRKDDVSKKDEKDRGTANTGTGKQDSNVGRSSGTGSSTIGSSHGSDRGTSQAPGKDSGANKGSNQPGMKR